MKVLVANRGEIACRVFKTCKRLLIPTVAVYSTADAESLFVKMADEAVCIGPPPTSQSYLNIQAIIDACKQTGATHVHPGYGFLSENAEFAKRLKENGIVFIGPAPESILSIGDKMRAKQLLRKHAPAVPLIPGYDGDDQSVDVLIKQAISIGFPVLIKASAGGGGKGMRVVRNTESLAEEIEMAKGEALRSFGDDKLLIEKYFERVKHVECQIIGDSHGNVYHCYERECSVQRRHQKVIEETPAPLMDSQLRAQMTEAAITIGQLIKYENAGTVEFILDPIERKFYFLEVNTRLQVEHPITEAVTGLDLVELQLFVAQGGNLKEVAQLQNLQIKGHAIEARLYAEDPNNNFFPCTGTIEVWQQPQNASKPQGYPRFDTGVTGKSVVSVYYDPLIAKITVHASNRQQAIEQLRHTLRQTVCLGVVTNKSFLIDVLGMQEFTGGQYTTKLIDNLTAVDPAAVGYPQARMLSTIGVCFKASTEIPNSLQQLSRVPHKDLIYPNVTPNSHSSLSVMQECLLVGALINAQGISQAAGSGTVYSHIPFGFRLNARWSPHREAFRITSPPPPAGSNDSRWVVEYINANSSSSSNNTQFYMRLLKERVKRPQKQKENQQKPIWQIEAILCPWIPVASAQLLQQHPAIEVHWGQRGEGCIKRVYKFHQQLWPPTTQSTETNMLYLHCDFWDRQVQLQRLELRDSLVSEGQDSQSAYTSTMPCRIVKLLVESGQVVKKGQALLTMESMKMETRLYSNHSGVCQLLVQEGQVLEAGTLMVRIDSKEE